MKNYKFKKELSSIILTIIFMLVYYFFMLPPINLTSPVFWFSVIVTIIFYISVSGIGNLSGYGSFDQKGYFYRNPSYRVINKLGFI